MFGDNKMLHPPKEEKRFKQIIFRNDDVSFDTDLARFIPFVETFHKAGFVQLHGVTIYGLCNYSLIQDGLPWIYESITRDEYHIYDKCVSASEKYYIGDNKKLIQYLNSIPDPIALHGLYHTDYSRMDYQQQEHDIVKGLEILKSLFPNKKIDTFIPPFNLTNEDTYRVCEKYGLRLSAKEGEHFEDRIDNDKGPLYDGELYRYHHHRFYPESTFSYYDLSIEKLKEYFQKYSYTYNRKTGRFIPSFGLKNFCLEDDEYFCQQGDPSVKVIERNVLEYTNCSDSIMHINSGRGELLESLWADGYEFLLGVEIDNNKLAFAQNVSRIMETDICYSECIETSFKEKQKSYDSYIFNYQSIEELNSLLDKCSRNQSSEGYYFIVGPDNCREKLIDAALKFNMMLLKEECINTDTGMTLSVFLRRKPRICLYCDTHNWAHDYSARELKKYLSNEFEIDIKFVIDKELLDVDSYDAFLVFWWGEKSYKWKKYSRTRIVKQVSSHRWQFDKPYGPISVEKFKELYLDDAYTVICPSEILYKQLINVCDHLFLCGKGFAENDFKYLSAREGDVSFCMVGNIKDPIKGVNDILIPSCEGKLLDYSDSVKHEDLCDFYNKHDVYVVSSLHEADPLPLIESMACGCFPIASKIGIAPELIRHKENGYLVEHRSVEEFRKAVDWCAENVDYIRAQAPNIAKEIYENRRWKVMQENYRMMFRDHVSRR